MAWVLIKYAVPRSVKGGGGDTRNTKKGEGSLCKNPHFLFIDYAEAAENRYRNMPHSLIR